MQKFKGQASLVGAFVGVMVIVLIGVSAILPTVQSSLTAGNFSGSLATVTDNIPLFIGIALLLVVVGLFGAGSFSRE